MKKIVGLLLAMVLMIGVLPSAAFAAGTPTVSITSGEVTPGGEVTLTVSIADNPGIAATLIYIYFDTSVFTVDPNSDIYAAGSFRKDGGLIGNSIALAKENGRYDGDMSKDGVLALWYNGSGMNTTGDGNVLTVTLQAAADAVNGSYDVSVGYSSEDTCNQNGENVKLSTGSGTVTVSGGAAAEPAPTPDPAPNPGTTPDPDPVPDPAPSVPIPGHQPSGEDTAESAPVFGDVSGSWAEEYILRAYASGLVNGYPDGTYGPGRTMTRAEFVTILWRASGSPAPAAAASFTDLKQSWYKDAVAWAQANNVVNGVGDNRFDPDGTVTREQIAAILHRMAGSPVGMEMAFAGIYDGFFADSGNVSSWAKSSLYWALYNEIYCGENSVLLLEGDLLAPRSNADRAQIAVMIIQYLDKIGGKN